MKRRKPLSRKHRKVLWTYVFLLPQLSLYLLLTIVPLGLALPVIFTDRLTYTDVDWDYVGLANFRRVATDDAVRETYLTALGRTLRFSLINYVVVMVMGLGLALLLFEFGLRGGSFTIIYLPYMISGLALGFMAVMLFSESSGSLNLLLERLGLLAKPFNIKEPTGTTLILPLMVAWRTAGFYVAIFLSGLLAIPQDTIEAAIVDGASYWQRLTKIYLPQMKAAFLIATIFAVFISFNVFDELVALGGLFQNKAAEFLTVVVFTYAFGSGQLALGMTLAVITFIPLVLFGVALQRLQRRMGQS